MAIDITKYDIDDSAKNLMDLMQGVLDRVVTSYASYGMPLPLRQYWTMGSPAMDCEQVVVSFIQMYLGQPGDQASRPNRCNSPRSAVLSVTVTREIPVVGSNGRAPEAAKIQKYGEVSALDAWILLESINLLDQWDELGTNGMGVIATIESLEPQGGLQTINLQITMVVP